MIEDKYTKPSTHGYVNSLYESGVTSYTLEKYEELLTDHLKEVKTSIANYKKSYPKSFNHKIVIIIENAYDGTDNLCYISGKEEMSKQEKITFDEGEKNKASRTDQFEKQQLANL